MAVPYRKDPFPYGFDGSFANKLRENERKEGSKVSKNPILLETK